MSIFPIKPPRKGANPIAIIVKECVNCKTELTDIEPAWLAINERLLLHVNDTNNDPKMSK